MAGQILWDQLIAGAGDAITDIRQKLVEEPWYGRALVAPAQSLDPIGSESDIGRTDARDHDRHIEPIEPD